MKELTKAEEQIMQVLWNMKEGFVKDIIAQLPEPRPAYTTVSTIVRILEKKGFLSYKAYGKTHMYFPIVDKKTYTRKLFSGMLSGYFGNSIRQMVSFFSKEKSLTVAELEALKEIIESEIQKQQEES